MPHSSVQRTSHDSANRALRIALEAETDAIAIHRDGKIVHANSAGLKLLGYERLSDVIGKPVLDFVAPHYRDIVAKRVFKTYAGIGKVPELEESFLDIGGREVPVEGLATPIDFEGKPSTLVHIRDIRMRKELQNKLRAADRLAHVGFVAGAVMHEIRGPLGYTLASFELLQNRLEDVVPQSVCDEVRELCDHVREGLLRLQGVVRDVGVFSGTLLDTSMSVDLHAVLDSIANLVGFELRGRARLVKSYGEVPYVVGTTAKLGHVFSNLLVNAAQAIPPGDEEGNRVTIRTYAIGSRVFVEISDTGRGIPASKVNDIFEPFVTTKDTGIGLGLSIARSLLEESGGSIRLESTSAKGTTFVVELTAVPAPS
jgi:two-component system NtrC family sensor kinase